MPRTRPTTRRFFRLLLAAAALLTVLVTAAPASAVIRPANINDTMDCSAHLCFSVKYDGILGWNVKQLAAWLPDANRKGHFEFFGPAGHIANSADRVWHINETYEINGLWTGNSDALWCARFWVYNAATRHWGTVSGNYCF